MSDPVWPSTLPQVPLANGYSENFAGAVVRSNMEVGPAKLRRRVSAVPVTMNIPMLMTGAQIATLETFYYATTVGGSLQFSFPRPRLGGICSVRFTSPPAIQRVGREWTVSFGLEVMP